MPAREAPVSAGLFSTPRHSPHRSPRQRGNTQSQVPIAAAQSLGAPSPRLLQTMAGSSSSPTPTSGKRSSFLSPSFSSFSDVVTAVSSSLRPASAQTPNTTAPPPLQRHRSGQQQQHQDERVVELPTSRWQRAAWKSEEFPELSHDQLMDLWPDDEEVRLCVRKAVEEMARE